MSAADVNELEPDGFATEAPPVVGEALRYLVASAAALALDFALLTAGVRGLGLTPWQAGALSYFAGLVFIYAVSVRWVFARRSIDQRGSEFVLFAIFGLVGLVLNSATLFVATSLGVGLTVAKALSAGIGFVANFVTRKCFLFSARRSR